MKKRKRLTYGNYPYTATRAKVMRSTLLTRDDYQKFQNMGFNEIARFLEEGQYHDDITGLSGHHSGLELIELAIKENFARTIEKLVTISSKEVRELIETYALQWVSRNYKLLLKVKMGILSQEEMDVLYLPLRPTTLKRGRELLEKDVPELIREVSLRLPIDSDKVREWFEGKDVVALENELDKAYYRLLLDMVKRMKLKKRDPLRQFIMDMIALTNIKTILRMKARDIDKERIAESLIPGSPFPGLLNAAGLPEAIDQLKNTSYAPLADERILHDLSLLETLAEQFLYREAYALIRQQPLSVAPVFGFLLLKEIEVRNIRIFIHAKSLELGKEFIDSTVVVK